MVYPGFNPRDTVYSFFPLFLTLSYLPFLTLLPFCIGLHLWTVAYAAFNREIYVS